MTNRRIGSLFTGVAGLDLAVEQFFDATTAWHAQYEPPDKNGREDPHQYAAAVLAHRYPGVPNHGDITTIDWAQVEPVDILTGGFPCTDVSLAGKRAGLNDQTRSGLWAHMARAISVLRPNLVVIENVRGLLSAPADGDMEPCTWCLGDIDGEPDLRALGAVLADLAELGFDAEWVGVPASDVGAPHERFRVFILAWPAAADADEFGAHRPWACGAGRDELADDRLAPSDAGRIGRLPAEHDVQPWQSDAGGRSAADTSGVGRGEGGAEPAGVVGGSDAPVGGSPDWGVYGPAIRRWEHVTGRAAPRPVDDRGRLAPVFVEWMMGAPAGWFTDVPVPAGMSVSQVRNAQLKAGGNGVVTQQAFAALGLLWARATASHDAATAA